MSRIMIAGTNSGCGKTSVVCSILQALVNRKVNVASFKCGPDYIDPMFHSLITGNPTYNLDRKFCDINTLKQLLVEHQKEISVIEGVMGFYDGANLKTSSYGISLDTDTPSVIVIDCKSMNISIGAIMQGFLSFRKNNIIGFIFNRLSESLIDQAKRFCDEFETEYLGRLPICLDAIIASRNLGLIVPDEIVYIKCKMQLLAELAEQNIRLDRLCEIANLSHAITTPIMQYNPLSSISIRVAVSRDSAFCFYYNEDFELLRKLGCEIVTFSPLNDAILPEHICGLWICGGYPELYAESLSENFSMLLSIKNAIRSGIPTIAEGGGFMYLCTEIIDENARSHKMVGIFEGKCYPTKRLQRFGYAELTSLNDNMLVSKGDKIISHEFHYWDCTCCGNAFRAKRSCNREDICVYADEKIYAGFPHLYLYSHPKSAIRFVKKCLEYRKNEKNKQYFANQ